jgi:hypothetical protein
MEEVLTPTLVVGLPEASIVTLVSDTMTGTSWLLHTLAEFSAWLWVTLLEDADPIEDGWLPWLVLPYLKSRNPLLMRARICSMDEHQHYIGYLKSVSHFSELGLQIDEDVPGFTGFELLLRYEEADETLAIVLPVHWVVYVGSPAVSVTTDFVKVE